jgi:glyoxylase-like metal-dependent hydrolase (beta-lactamase superfamily II)
MKILMNTGGIASTNCYLVADEMARQAVVFDAPDHTAAALLDESQNYGWDVIGLWLTHGHFDHIADHEVVTKRFPHAKLLIHELDEPKLLYPQSRIFQLPFSIAPRKADVLLHDGQQLKLGSIDLEVIHTPGHASGHICYHFPKEKVLIGGDLIIMGAVGRTDLPDSSYPDLQASIRRIMQLPGETKLLPGHGQISTLGDERQSNPYVQEALGD